MKRLGGKDLRPILAGSRRRIVGIILIAVLVCAGLLTSQAWAAESGLPPGNSLQSIPVAVDDAYSVAVNGSLSITAPGVLANDTDATPEHTLTAVLGLTTTHGTLNLSADGSFTYAPVTDYHGVDSFTYTATDGTAQSNTATVTITVNTAPVIIGDNGVATNEETAREILLTDFVVTDPDNTYPTDFTLIVQDGSNYTRVGATITPNTDFNGNLTVPVTVNDGLSDSNTYNLTVTVNPVNDVPQITAQATPLSTNEDTDLTITLGAVTVTDPDNVFPGDFTLAVLSGTHYTFIGNTITPEANYSGSLTVPVTVNDGAATSSPFDLSVTVNAVNDAPVLGAIGNKSINELTELTFTATATDVDLPPNTLTYSLAAGTSGAVPAGALINSGTGAFSWTPTEAQGPGGYTFDVCVSDGLASDCETITVTVNEVNTPPVLGSIGNKTINELTELSFTATATDSDLPANTLTYSLAAGTSGAVPAGALINSGTGAFSWTPTEAQGPGGYTFDVCVSDGLASDCETITVTVNEVNSPPAGTDHTVTMLEDSSNTFAVSDFGFSDPNDLPVANTFLAVKITTLPALGTLRLDGIAVTAGQFVTVVDINLNKLVYTPVLNGNGTAYASFTFQVQDDGGTANGGVDLDPTANTMTIDVTAVNDAPVAVNDNYGAIEDTLLTVNLPGVLGNDTDVDGNTLSAILVSGPSNGALTLSADGSFTYMPVSNYFGPDSFTYKANDGTVDSNVATVSINVAAVNDNPVVVADAVSTLEDTAWQQLPNVLTANDTDVDSPSLSLTGVSNPVNGTVLFPAAGDKVRFTPTANYHGTGYFDYTISDGQGGTATGTVTVTITSVNDAPAGANNTVTILEDSSKIFAATDFGFSDLNDSPANAFLAVKISSLPLLGTLRLDGVAVTAGQFVSVTDINLNKLVYTPVLNGNGTAYASFTFQVQDDGGTANGGVDLDPTPRTMTINVTAVNDAPVAMSDSYDATEDTLLNVAAAGVLSNDSDVDGNPLTAILVGDVSHGTLTLNADGSFSYMPAANYNGSDSFTYKANDGTVDSNTVTVTLTIAAVNDAPVASIDNYPVNEDTLLSVPAPGVLTNDSDIENNPLTAVLVLDVSHGVLTLNDNGSFSYMPASNYNGSDSFTYQAYDGAAYSNIVTVTIPIAPVNDAPVGIDSSVTTLEDTAKVFAASDFGFNDPSDSPQNTFAAVTITTLPGGGSLKVNGVNATAGQMVSLAELSSGYLVYTPAANANGTAYSSFTFQVQDNGSGVPPNVNLDATPNLMTIHVTLVNDAPQGADNTISAYEDVGKVLTAADFGFSDPLDSPGNDLEAVTIVAIPSSGTLTLNGTPVVNGQSVPMAQIDSGLLVYTSALNANGAGYTNFTFKVQDNGGTANGGVNLDPTANTITVDVTAVNDAPVGINSSVTTLEDTLKVFAASDFGFSDPSDSPENSLLAVKIASLPGPGTLTFDGTPASAGLVVSAVELTAGKLTYIPALNGNGAGYASFTFQVQDDGGTANGGVDLDSTPNTMTINVTAVNDAPVAAADSVSTLEDTNWQQDPSVLLVNDTDVESNPLSFTGVSNAVNGTVLFPIAVDKVRFTPNANFNGTGSFDYTINDSAGGTATGTVTVTIISVNDAPAGANKTVTMLEDGSISFATADFGFSDLNDSPANTFLAVKITTLPILGSLKLDGVPVFAGQTVTTADITANKLVYSPALNGNGAGYASYTFQVQDNGSILNGGIDLDPTPRTMTIDITSVNDAPAGTNNTVAILEDSSKTFTTAEFGFTDPNDSPVNALLAVKITTLPVTGTLELNGSAVSAEQIVSAVDISANRLVYTPVLNGNGTGYASFTFQVQDDGGAANGGVDLDPTPNTMTVDVTSVNDAPAGQDETISMLEDTAKFFGTADFTLTDTNDSPPNALAAVSIVTIPVKGTLALSGVPIAPGQSVSLAQIDGGQLTFLPDPNANGAGYTSFTFKVQDDGGISNGGIDLDPTANTITINVTSVNDAPSGTDNAVTILEDSAKIFTTGDFGFGDSNDSPVNIFLAVKVINPPSTGSLKLDGVTVNPNQTVTVTDINASKLVYIPALNGNGLDYASFTFKVQDNGGTLNGGVDLDPTANTITIHVTPVNDDPVAVTDFVTIPEDNGLTQINVLANDTDVDIPPNTLSVIGVGVAAHGYVGLGPGGAYVAYTPVENYFGADSFTYTLSDGVGGTSTGTINITITAVNDAPVLGTIGGKTVNELAALVFTATATDVDLPADPLTFSLEAGAAGAIPAGAAIDSNSGAFSWTPTEAQGPGSSTFDVCVSDGTVSDCETVHVTVNEVNTAPSGADNTLTTLEDQTLTFTTAHFSFSDSSDIPVNTFYRVLITTLPGNGSLKLGSTAVTVGQYVTAADITGGNLKFEPDANENGAAYASFTFQVQDNGGIAYGGADLDPTPNTITVNVTSVNDAPVGANKTVTILEDNSKIFAVADFGFTDPNDNPTNAFLAVKITTLPAAGTLMADGVAVTAGQIISVIDITANKLTFTPAVNGNGTAYASFTFQVQDNGGTANGGVDLDLTPKTMTINVTPVEDIPVGVDDTYAVLKNTPIVGPNVVLTISAPGVLSNDSDGDGDPLTVSLKTQASLGTVVLNANGSFTYTIPETIDTGTDSFTYTLTDGKNPVDVTVHLTIDRVPPPLGIWVAPVLQENWYTGSNETVELKVSFADISDVNRVKFSFYNSRTGWVLIGTDSSYHEEGGQYTYSVMLDMTTLPYGNDTQVLAETYDAAGNVTYEGPVAGKYSRIFINRYCTVFLPLVRK